MGHHVLGMINIHHREIAISVGQKARDTKHMAHRAKLVTPAMADASAAPLFARLIYSKPHSACRGATLLSSRTSMQRTMC